MVFNATHNNISVISWWSVLLEEEIGGHIEYTSPSARSELITLRVMCTDFTGSCESNNNHSHYGPSFTLVLYVIPERHRLT
jgi:hypothetical protein